MIPLCRYMDILPLSNRWLRVVGKLTLTMKMIVMRMNVESLYWSTGYNNEQNWTEYLYELKETMPSKRYYWHRNYEIKNCRLWEFAIDWNESLTKTLHEIWLTTWSSDCQFEGTHPRLATTTSDNETSCWLPKWKRNRMFVHEVKENSIVLPMLLVHWNVCSSLTNGKLELDTWNLLLVARCRMWFWSRMWFEVKKKKWNVETTLFWWGEFCVTGLYEMDLFVVCHICLWSVICGLGVARSALHVVELSCATAGISIGHWENGMDAINGCAQLYRKWSKQGPFCRRMNILYRADMKRRILVP